MKKLLATFLLLFSTQALAAIEQAGICSTDYRAALERHAYQGDAKSASIIGMIEEMGFCGSPELLEAEIWYEIAARLGDPYAQFRLGNIRYYSKDESAKSRAKVWYEKAARQGVIGAMVKLANMHMLGEAGNDNDLTKAYCWFAKANDGVIPDSQNINDNLLQKMSESEIDKAKGMTASGSCESSANNN